MENEKLTGDPEFGLKKFKIILQTWNALADLNGGEICHLF